MEHGGDGLVAEGALVSVGSRRLSVRKGVGGREEGGGAIGMERAERTRHRERVRGRKS